MKSLNSTASDEGKRVSQVHHVVQEKGRLYGTKDRKAIEIVNNSTATIIIVLTNDPHERQLTSLDVGVGTSGGKVKFGLEARPVVAQIKPIPPHTSTIIDLSSSAAYITAVRKKTSNGKYSVFRSNYKISQGSQWTVTDSIVDSVVSVQHENFLDQFMNSNNDNKPDDRSVHSNGSSSTGRSKPHDVPALPPPARTCTVDELVNQFRGLSASDKAEFGRRIFSMFP